MKTLNRVVSVVLAAVLGACGGGSGGSSTGTATTGTSSSTASTFNYRQAVLNNDQNGLTLSFNATASGASSCSGSGTFVQSPLTSLTTFNTLTTQGVSALSGAITITINWTNCSPTPTLITSTDFIDSTTLVPLGFSEAGVYGVYTAPPVIPASVAVGNTGSLGAVQLYTDSTETASLGSESVQYAVSAGADSSDVTLTVTTQSYDATGTLVATVTEVDQLSAAGVLTPVSITMVNLLTGTTITLN